MRAGHMIVQPARRFGKRAAMAGLEHASTRRSYEAIVTAVAAEFEVRAEIIHSDRQDKKPALARHVAMILAHRLLAYSLPRIGRVAQRDHTTVLHAIRRVEALSAADPAFAARVDALAHRIEQQNRSDG